MAYRKLSLHLHFELCSTNLSLPHYDIKSFSLYSRIQCVERAANKVFDLSMEQLELDCSIQHVVPNYCNK